MEWLTTGQTEHVVGFVCPDLPSFDAEMHVDRKYDHECQENKTFQHHEGRIDGGLCAHEEGPEDHGGDINQQAKDRKAPEPGEDGSTTGIGDEGSCHRKPSGMGLDQIAASGVIKIIESDA